MSNNSLHTNLINKGFTSFNLKDYDVTLYNKLRKIVPYNRVSSVVNPILVKFVFCARIFTTLDSFFKKLEPMLVDIGYDIENKEYLYHKNRQFEQAKNDSGGGVYVRMDFPSNDYIMLDKIKQTLFLNFKFAQDQSWYETDSLRVNEGNRGGLQRFFRNMVREILESHYPIDISNYFIPENFSAQITCFPNNSLITPHKDGANELRLAVILLYLNDDWKSEYGGQLVVDETEVVQPEFGNVTILDFTQNNIHHEVLEVMGNSRRYAYVSFLDIRNM